MFVEAMGKGLSGDNVAKMNADGTFSMDVTGTAPGVVHLVATESSGSPEYRMLRVGLKRDISVGGGNILSGVEIALDHALDQTQSVNVNGWQDYTGELSASLVYSLDGVELFRTSAEGTSPLHALRAACGVDLLHHISPGEVFDRGGLVVPGGHVHGRLRSAHGAGWRDGSTESRLTDLHGWVDLQQ